MKGKKINTFAILVILLIAVPEVVGHSLFDKSHPADSSVKAVVSLTDKISKDPKYNLNCSLAIQDDPPGANVARAAGLEGKYWSYLCV
jgi:methionine-rich copper-binding protein CopC